MMVHIGKVVHYFGIPLVNEFKNLPICIPSAPYFFENHGAKFCTSLLILLDAYLERTLKELSLIGWQSLVPLSSLAVTSKNAELTSHRAHCLIDGYPRIAR